MKSEIARALLSVQAVFLRPGEPFIWASGIKSPIYTDIRLVLSSPEVRNQVEATIAETVKREFPDCEALMGTSTAGIPHAAIAAHLLGIPMGYVRSASKDHGRKNRIEGTLTRGEKVVVIEDQISTAGSVVTTVEALRDAGAEVLGVVSICTYGLERGIHTLEAANVRAMSLTDIDTVVAVAVEEGYVSQEDAARVLKFRDNPLDESWMEKAP